MCNGNWQTACIDLFSYFPSGFKLGCNDIRDFATSSSSSFGSVYFNVNCPSFEYGVFLSHDCSGPDLVDLFSNESISTSILGLGLGQCKNDTMTWLPACGSVEDQANGIYTPVLADLNQANLLAPAFTLAVTALMMLA